MNLEIRRADPADADSIVRATAQMAIESEGRALDPDTLAGGVRAVLDDESLGRFWVAVADGRIVGQIMITKEWSDWRNAEMWWVQSVYVDPGVRRKGIFTALYRYVEHLAREDSGCCGIRLYVERDNAGARKTYAALGMSEPGYVVMQSEFPV